MLAPLGPVMLASLANLAHISETNPKQNLVIVILLWFPHCPSCSVIISRGMLCSRPIPVIMAFRKLLSNQSLNLPASTHTQNTAERWNPLRMRSNPTTRRPFSIHCACAAAVLLPWEPRRRSRDEQKRLMFACSIDVLHNLCLH